MTTESPSGQGMSVGRLEAFSDGVFAIIITITVLELHTPDGFTWSALANEAPTFIAYVLSFLFVAIYWNNHHHLLKTVHQVSASIMWANMALLFWLTLMPFVTGWVGTSYGPKSDGDHVVPMVVYGIVQFLAGTSYYVLQTLIVKAHGGPESHLGAALGRDWKGHISPFIYVAGILVSFVAPLAGFAIYATGAIIWLVPDRRLEKVLREEEFHSHED
jgi:uncharacterized membrane protein